MRGFGGNSLQRVKWGFLSLQNCQWPQALTLPWTLLVAGSFPSQGGPEPAAAVLPLDDDLLSLTLVGSVPQAVWIPLLWAVTLWPQCSFLTLRSPEQAFRWRSNQFSCWNAHHFSLLPHAWRSVGHYICHFLFVWLDFSNFFSSSLQLGQCQDLVSRELPKTPSLAVEAQPRLEIIWIQELLYSLDGSLPADVVPLTINCTSDFGKVFIHQDVFMM